VVLTAPGVLRMHAEGMQLVWVPAAVAGKQMSAALLRVALVMEDLMSRSERQPGRAD